MTKRTVQYAACINCAAGDTRTLPPAIRETVTEFIPPPGAPTNWLGNGNVGPFCDQCWSSIFGENANRASVFAAIDGEREYQERRWTGPRHTEVTPYLVFIRHYLRRAEDLASTLNCDAPLNKAKVMDVVRKIAALTIAAMEEHGVVPRAHSSARR